MKNLTFLVILLWMCVFCQAQEFNSPANPSSNVSGLLTWHDLDLILQSSPLIADSILKAKNFICEKQRAYNFQGADGTLVSIQLIDEGIHVNSFNLKANSSAICDDLYQQLINDLSARHIVSISSSAKDMAFFEAARLFRVRMDTFKYSHYGLEIQSE